MDVREIDHSYILLHLKELAHLHTLCFHDSEVWRENWTDFPGGGSSDSLSYLLDAAGRDTHWVAAIDTDGSILGTAGRVLGCGILERLSRPHAAALGIPLGDRAGRVFYNAVYFHHLSAQGLGLAHRVIDKRIELAKALGGDEIWCRTRADHDRMHRILRHFGFEVQGDVEVEEAGVRSPRRLYCRAL